MATIVLSNSGSAGDLHPFIAIGHQLAARGHTVTLAVETSLLSIAERSGLNVAPLTGTFTLAGADGIAATRGGGSSLDLLRYITKNHWLPDLELRIEELRTVCAQADLLITGPTQFLGSFVADLTGISWASLVPHAIILPGPDQNYIVLPKWIPRPMRAWMDYQIVDGANRSTKSVVDDPVNVVRQKLGLSPRSNMLSLGNLSSSCIAVAVSPTFIHRLPNWPSQAEITGWCFWDGGDAWTPDEATSAFLAGDTPLIAVTAGSTAAWMPQSTRAFYQTAVQAVRSLGARAVVLGAEPSVGAELRAADVLPLEYAPLSVIFPHCATAIIHGGIGTIALALRAGLPTVVVPWGADQVFNAHHLAELGAGRYVPFKRWTPQHAAEALKITLHSQAMRQRAEALAGQVRAEDGLNKTCDLLEARLRSAVAAGTEPGA